MSDLFGQDVAWSVMARRLVGQTLHEDSSSSLESVVLSNNIQSFRLLDRRGNVFVVESKYGHHRTVRALFINDLLRFSSSMSGVARVEALVYLALESHPNTQKVILETDVALLALKEVFKFRQVQQVAVFHVHPEA